MCPQSMLLSKIEKIVLFYLKIVIFTAVENQIILIILIIVLILVCRGICCFSQFCSKT